MNKEKKSKKESKEMALTKESPVDEKKSKKLKLASPLFFIALCAILITGTAFSLQNRSIEKQKERIKAINSEFIDLNASSDAWSCPYVASGATENGNNILLYNPSENDASVTIRFFALDGKILATKDIELKKKAIFSELISAYGPNVNVSAIVESFGAPIIVYRSIKLADGAEVVPCVKNPKDILELDNLTTKRNTNTTLMLNNPHNDSVVVDVKARLVDTSTTPYKVVLDDSRGIVIGAYGRTDIDLQAMFGRYSLINVTVVARSGFITGEALVDYKDGTVANGQTLVSSALTNYSTDTSYIFGNSPLSLYAQSNTDASTFVDVSSYTTENRMLNNEEQSLNVGATVSIADPGTDFGFHVVKLKTKASKVIKNSNDSDDNDQYTKVLELYNSFISTHLSKDVVAGYNASSLTSKSIILPSKDTDIIGLFNTSDKLAKVTINFIVYPAIPTKVIEISPNSFVRFSLNDFEISSGDVFLSIDSNQELVAGSTRVDESGITIGAYLKK